MTTHGPYDEFAERLKQDTRVFTGEHFASTTGSSPNQLRRATDRGATNPGRRTTDFRNPQARPISPWELLLVAILVVLVCIVGWWMKRHDDMTLALLTEVSNVKYVWMLSDEDRQKLAKAVIMPRFIRDALEQR